MFFQGKTSMMTFPLHKLITFFHIKIGDSMYYLNCFFVYSCLGFLLETIVSIVTHQNFNSGILYGPITPVYGIGVILILVISHYFFMNLHLPRWRETVIVFFILTVTLTLLEWLGGVLIEKIFGIVFWDYSKLPFHIGHYISLEISFLWGFLSIFLIYLIKPIIDPLIKGIPTLITIFFLFLFLIDCGFSFFHLKGWY